MTSLAKYKKIFGEFAADADFINEIIVNLNLKKDSKILDIGTGMGAMSILLALNGYQILTGKPEIDQEKDDMGHHDHHHEENNEHFCENHEEHHGEPWDDWRTSAKNLGVENQIKFQNFDVQKLIFANESFSGIFLYDTLQHVKNRKEALNECIRVVKYDGVVVVFEWTKKQIEEDFEKYGFKIDYIDPRDLLNREDILIEVINSEKVNAYLLRNK